VPLARRAFLRSSSGTSTVILRAVSIVSHHTILKTSAEYGTSYSPSWLSSQLLSDHWKLSSTRATPESRCWRNRFRRI